MQAGLTAALTAALLMDSRLCEGEVFVEPRQEQ
jgi:hypothetical protein